MSDRQLEELRLLPQGSGEFLVGEDPAEVVESS
jgi:hypothetical protein